MFILPGGNRWENSAVEPELAADYVDAPAVRDRGLITASGLGDVEFARELFEELNVLSADDRAAWAAMFRSARLPQTG